MFKRFFSATVLTLLSISNSPAMASELDSIQNTFNQQVTEVNRAIEVREKELGYKPGQLAIRFQSSKAQLAPKQTVAQIAKVIEKWSLVNRKTYDNGNGVDDFVTVELVDAQKGSLKAFECSNDGEELNPANKYDKAFLDASRALQIQLSNAIESNPNLKLFTVVSWDSYVTINELAIADLATGKVLFVGTLFL